MGVDPVRPSVLIDECLPRSLGEVFAAAGYEVHVVGALLPGGSPDVSVVAAALDVGAIVVTTDSDFRRMKASAEGQGGRLERADRVYFKRCSHVEARARVAELMDVIDREYRLAKQNGRKFFIQITRESYTVYR